MDEMKEMDIVYNRSLECRYDLENEPVTLTNHLNIWRSIKKAIKSYVILISIS